MNILMINYEFPPVGGGGGIATCYIARELCSKGHQVTVLTSCFRDLRRYEEIEGIRIYRVPVLRKRRDYCSVPEMATFILSSMPKLLSLMITQRYDLCHIFFGVPSGPLGYLAKKLFGVPYLIRMGGGDVPGFRPFQYKRLYSLLKPFLNALWRNADFLVANSDGLRTMARKTFREKPIHVIPNGVDLSRFANSFQHHPASEVRILFVSRVIQRKGLRYLIDAVPAVCEQAQQPFVIHIVGDGPDNEFFTQQIQEAGLNSYFRFHGYIDHDKLPQYYRDADIFVLPSLAEGMPNVVLEAIGSGLPVIATRVPGSEDLVHDGENGFLLPPRDSAALSRALLRLINDRGLREIQGTRSREIARDYGWTQVAGQYLDLYRQVVLQQSSPVVQESLEHV
ncbi:glycosyl transferase [candidate division KSB3 bacterium]|uniref:Glycosyl transferase n=1 Tax=candidate division KSB3 bacterium TaxID=2044937 RepID=A0A2G6E381_9BACT|nr:MAG: glycosyl transferase [candidate division KSB3 bacterium]PIE29075.1 MAG: glycosyl transferase [candidate division KSB3 bacterium]